MSVGLNTVLVGSAALFAVGGFAILARRSALVMLMGTQFMFAGAAIAFVAFGRFGLGAQSQTAALTMALFAGAIAVAELAVGLTMAVLLFHEQRSFLIDPDRR